MAVSDRRLGNLTMRDFVFLLYVEASYVPRHGGLGRVFGPHL